MGSDVEEEQDTEALRARAKQMMDYIVGQIERGQRLGADFTEVEGMLMGAVMMVEDGSYEDAFELINECSDEAGKRLLEFENLVRTIKKAEMEIMKARENGQDVGEAARLLGLARTQQEQGRYDMGLVHAKNSVEALAQKKEAEIAWGSGL